MVWKKEMKQGSVPVDDGSNAVDAGSAATDIGSDEMRETIADLELRLDQAELRAQRAYSAAEAAEAALAYEKERRMSLAPTLEPENETTGLRQRIAELLERVSKAEEATRKAEADLAAVRAGVEPQPASAASSRNSDTSEWR